MITIENVSNYQYQPRCTRSWGWWARFPHRGRATSQPAGLHSDALTQQSNNSYQQECKLTRNPMRARAGCSGADKEAGGRVHIGLKYARL